jgi:hypothetical protein
MNLLRIKTVCRVAIAAAVLCGGCVHAPAAQIMLAGLPKPVLTLPQLLVQSFITATNGRQENIFNSDWTWNQNELTYGLTGFTASAPVFYPGGDALPATALTRRHLYVRGHSNGATNDAVDPAAFVGRSFVFFTAQNVPVTNSIIAAFKRYDQPNTNGQYIDYCLLLTSNDLPASITPMRVLDTNAVARINAYALWNWSPLPNYPILGTCQHNDVGGLNFAVFSNHSFFIGGDSGSVNFIILNGEMLFVAGRTTTGYSPQMQADANTLSTWAGLNPANYQIQTESLTEYP